MTDKETFPTIHVISDSVGLTARAVARAAAAQFHVYKPRIEMLSRVKHFEDVERFVDESLAAERERTGEDRLLVFFTLVSSELAREIRAYFASRDDVVAVDLMTGPVGAIGELTGLVPTATPGTMRETNESYYRRIEAIEFTISHDDGRNPQDLALADIVILGVSRSSKTPTSIYLAQQGYKVANVPLDLETEPAEQIFDVDRTRLFGLMTTPDVLVPIRQRRLGRAMTVASSYADPERVYKDLDKAHRLMRKLGCIVINTKNRAVEETAQEILKYYEKVHPPSDIIE
ncbi:pyruvate, water dikinase regulatory protein [Xiamenia xianingshaonis]|uniref:Putative pyruvate, phosphate dikinase regulatory protein n=1 Tax=Xiamenia xianingshaonis TaxID=2682776 RepID=A0A9E6MPE7_9ACTN|nr:pyruvate, water dikinase regulatory protein [Xiamenia xianingshaonis]NGM17142.1 pyruvate, phosphate dikinase/phosphoenolpyruvate synthase regulator [Eggerthellaceae bacterium zg-893]NHM13825.1 pyruvate, phosphate dikinase/phosphoenolpyruvate synthase regulator [Xiamenia xianingshaonis]NHM16180.1 pyruvate, phosphate dikinase/phosphoenolpyruvate synthase regulator [Xiamenia xianingshaonis]QTU83685.1 kinase/pyrophosphorylase [Xiamenia xianingshaonis]